MASFCGFLAAADYVRVITVDPENTLSCPSPLMLTTGPSSAKVCMRSTFPSSSVIANTSSAMYAAGNIKGRNLYSSIRVTMRVYEKGSMDAFQTGLRTSALDSSDYVDGISFTRGSPRVHVFTFAISNSYDTQLLTTGMCPCMSGTRTLYCGGTSAPAFVGGNVVCDSGTYGNLGTAWVPRRMDLNFTVSVPLTNDILEVRLMSDQPYANEDSGVQLMWVDVYEEEDNVAPVLTLTGNSILRIAFGSVYTEPGATCVDALDGVLVPVITPLPSTVSTTFLGNQVLTYTCSDTHANIASVTRTIQVQDTEAPQVFLRAGGQQCVVQGDPYVEYGAQCIDNYDGVWEATVAGTVNTAVPGSYTVTYACVDTSANAATAPRTVLVITSPSPGTLGVDLISMQTSSSGAYTSVGYGGILTNVNPRTDLLVQWSGTLQIGSQGCRYLTVTEGPGGTGQVNRQYETRTTAALTVSGLQLRVAQSFTMALKYTNTWPLCANLGACFTGLDLQVAKERCLATPDCMGFCFSAATISGGLGDGCLKTSCQVEAINGYGTVSHSTGPHGYWEKQVATTSYLSSSLKDLTTYTVSVDEGFVVATAGGQGNVAQAFAFTTGDYTGPVLQSSAPTQGELAWPLQVPWALVYNKAILSGSGNLQVRRVVDGLVEQVPCNGSPSTSGMSIVIAGTTATVTGIFGWLGWRGCRDYQLTIGAGCFVDSSVNANPTTAVGPIAFVTACVTGVDPPDGAIGVAITTPLVFTFADTVRLGSGSITVQPLGGTARVLTSLDFPYIYASGATVTVDLACTTRTCILMGGNRSSSGWCTGLSTQTCRGKVMQAILQAGAVRFSSQTWPATSLLVSATDAFPKQPGSAAFRFTLAAASLTPPTLVSITAAATSATGIRVQARLNGAGVLSCAALTLPTGTPCSAVTVVNDISAAGYCTLQVRPDCRGCVWPTYGCVDDSSMWVDSGCSGTFNVDGVQVQCYSALSAASLYDGGSSNTLTTGYRHACAIRKLTAARSLSCWGDASSITPGPPAGNFSSVGSGYRHSCGIVAETGAIVCWGGTNLYGERNGPAAAAGSAYSQVTSGYMFSCALRVNDSQAVCWGLNDLGQGSPPATTFLTISAGERHVCGVRASDHNVECWGRDDAGQATAPSGVPFLARSPTGEALPQGSISAGFYHTCAIREDDGQVVCWGDNSTGQAAPPAMGPALELAAGRAHTCAVLKTTTAPASVANGTVICWGLNNLGQASPPAGLTVNALSAGDDYTCALTLYNGSAVCWGRNEYGQARPPTNALFGTLDTFSRATCQLNLASRTPDRSRIRAAAAARQPGAAAAVAVLSPAQGFAEAALSLEGLSGSASGGGQFDVYCVAEDNEVPSPNVMSTAQMLGAVQRVTLLDTIPPTMQVLRPYTSTETSVTVSVKLSEAGTLYCAAFSPALPPPTVLDIRATGGRAPTGAGFVATITLDGLLRDTDYNVYCAARDRAGTATSNPSKDNWTPYSAVLLTQTNVHTMYDSRPPALVAVNPPNKSLCTCVPDGFTPGCMTTVSLTFSEDIFRGTGSVNFVCISNFGGCVDVAVPLDTDTFAGGTTSIVNTVLYITFTSPLVDASIFKVVFAGQALTDASGNAFRMDVFCPPGFNPSWQTQTQQCAAGYSFATPS